MSEETKLIELKNPDVNANNCYLTKEEFMEYKWERNFERTWQGKNLNSREKLYRIVPCPFCKENINFSLKYRVYFCHKCKIKMSLYEYFI